MRGYGNLINRLMEDTTGNPTVGMGATICMFSDRNACTVIKVISPKEIVVQEDTATRTDSNGMSDSQDYSYAPNPIGCIYEFTKRKNGRWVRKGESLGDGTGLRLGDRDAYHDYSF